jgi:hypothetical protein
MYCCAECFSVQEIKEFIIGYENIGDCDYCDSKSVNIANIREVGEFIMEGVGRAFEDPVNQVGYESAEGGYLLPTDDIFDILIFQEEIFSDKIYDPYAFIDALVPDTITEYVQRDPYGPPRGNSDEMYHWEKFCKLLKTNRRYTAFLPDDEAFNDDLPSPKDLMTTIASELVMEHFHIIKKGTKIYRARIEKRGVTYKHEDLTSPPPKNARNNRMSPVGISFFYGALERKTCISELRPSVGELVIVAEFLATQDIIVLDLSGDIQEVPSIFSKEYSHQFERWISFIRHFVADISKPIRPMDQEIDYVPTQIFTEFLRIWNFKDVFYFGEPDQTNKLSNINGLQFKSSLRENGKNLVLFRGPEISVQTNSKIETWLSYKGAKAYEVTKVDIFAKKERPAD